MALKPCKECGKDVSTTVTKCPHCGKRLKLSLLALGCIGCLGITVFTFASCVGLAVLGSSGIGKMAEHGLGAEANEPQNANNGWQYSTNVDDLSGKEVYNAAIRSSNFQSFDFPYNGQTYGTLILRKHPRYGKDIIFQIDRGQILCHTYDSCPFTLRFDEGSPIKMTGNPSEDNSSDTAFLPYNRLFHKIKNSKKLVIGIPIYQEGVPTFVFDTKNLEWRD